MKKLSLAIIVVLLLTSCAPNAVTDQPPVSPAATSETLKTNRPTSAPTAPRYKTFSRIAFVSNRDGNDEIYSMEADLSDAVRLTDSPFLDGGPSWSSDGKLIVFHTERDGNVEIYSMDKFGGSQTNLTNSPWDDKFPDWSPDMQKIVFESMRDGDLEIYVMNADGSGQTRITNNPGIDGTARWSPDGKKIAFSSVRENKMDVYIMNPDGSEQTNLSNYPSDNSSPAWSPDGKQIAFDSNRDGQWELYIMNSDGSNQTRVTNNMGFYGFPDWSPDGRVIAYMCDNGTDYDICLYDVEDGTYATLTGSPAFEYGPRWSPGTSELADKILKNITVVIQPTTVPTVIPTIPPTLAAATTKSPSTCGAASGNWSTPDNAGVAIIFTIADCRITLVMAMGILNGEWVTVSTSLDEPIVGSQFNIDYSFTETDRFNFSGTFLSSASGTVQLIFYKGFRFSDTYAAGEDVLVSGTALLGP